MESTKLLKLAALLRKVPKEKFHMDTWGEAAKPILRGAPQCATRACALVWATAIPEFAAEGLELLAYPGARLAVVNYRGFTEFAAARLFFGLNVAQANYLFYDGSRTPGGKAREISAFVRSGGKVPA